MPSSITSQEFAAKWSGDTHKERSVAHEHFIALCRLVGHDTPGETRDSSLAFEAGIDERLQKFYEGRVSGGIDFVLYWFERTRELIRRGEVRRVGDLLQIQYLAPEAAT